MLVLLSPAKRLDYTTPVPIQTHELPEFADQAHELVRLLAPRSAAQLAALMKLSAPLAELNHQRYAQWSRRFTTKNSRAAIFAFAGDVYEGLDAYSLKPESLEWAHQHLVILSGLYGALRPLDWMQAYRLEMGTALANRKGKDLYAFWQERLTDYLIRRLERDRHPAILNLASQEYAKVVDREKIAPALIDCVFEDWSSGEWKVVGLFAKRARGLMARFVIEQRIERPQDVQAFSAQGYKFERKLSDDVRWVFRRHARAAQ